MNKMLLLSTTRWNPIIQISDGVKNKFKRMDGKPFPKGKNIYFLQQELFDIMTDNFKTIDMEWKYSWQ